MSYFVAFKIFLPAVSDVSKHGSLCIYLTWGSWSCGLMFSIKFEKFSPLSPQIFFPPSLPSFGIIT
jgi:hypothetical protein